MDTRPEFTQLFIQYVLPVLVAGLMGLVGRLLAKYTQKVEAQADSTKTENAVSRFTHFMSIIVADMNATVVPEMRKRSADGKLDAEDMAKLRALAMARLMTLVGENGMSELRKTLGIFAPSLETYLFGLLERSVSTAKAPTAATTVIVGNAAPSP